MKKILIAFGALLLLSFSLLATTFPEPTGHFKVGTTAFELVDDERLDQISADPADFRRLVVRAWYPAVLNGEAKAPYLTEAHKMGLNMAMGIPMAELEALGLSNSYVDAAPLQWNEFPVVIFAHGMGGYENQNFVMMEELASQGYIVFSINYTYYSMITSFADGTKAFFQPLNVTPEEEKKQMQDLIAMAIQIKATEDLAEKQRIMAEFDKNDRLTRMDGVISQLWIEDTLFFIDTLQDGNFSSPLFDELREAADLENIGMFGHSFGGSTATLLSLKSGSPIKAGLNMDGRIFPNITECKAGCANCKANEKKRKFKLKKPFLFMTQGKSPLVSGLVEPYYLASKRDIYSVTVAGTTHYDFTDLIYIPAVKASGMLSAIDNADMTEIMKKTIVPFFNTYLKGYVGAMQGSPVKTRPDVIFDARNVAY